MSAKQIIDSGLFQTAVELMDDSIRETVNQALAPCTELEFLAVYMALHKDKYNAEFTI